MPRINYQINLSGQGDGDPAKLEKAFAAAILDLRAAGLPVDGVLAAGVQPEMVRGELVPAVTIHTQAGDVEEPKAEAKAKAKAEHAPSTTASRAAAHTAAAEAKTAAAEAKTAKAEADVKAKAKAEAEHPVTQHPTGTTVPPTATVEGGGVKVATTTTTTASPVKKA